jgi:hypothetical protein
MARLTQRELEEIVKRDLPGYRIVRRSGEETPTHAEPDEAAPPIEELQKKYFGEEEGGAGSDAPNPGNERAESTEDEILTVEPEQAVDPYDHSARPKTIVVSGDERRIIGSQG